MCDDFKPEATPHPPWIAPEGKIWVCRACGKRSEYQAGYQPGFKCDYGWDVSCFLNSELQDGVYTRV
jgi:hypothetical protein